MNFFHPELQLKNAESAIESKLKYIRFVIALVLKLKKNNKQRQNKVSTFHLNSKTETIIHDSDTDNVLESNYSMVLTKIQKYQVEGSSWTIDLVIEHNIIISKYNPLSDSSCIKLSTKLNHSRKGFINI